MKAIACMLWDSSTYGEGRTSGRKVAIYRRLRTWSLRQHTVARAPSRTAEEFVSSYSKSLVEKTRSGPSSSSFSWQRDLLVAKAAIETNSFYVEFHLDERKMLKYINLTPPADSFATASVSSYGGLSSSCTGDTEPKPMSIRQFVSWVTAEHALDPDALAGKLREARKLEPLHSAGLDFIRPW